jgi:hypothetical protein
MPEIKHTFTAGKMDKDLDERLVRNGEYRDALNVQVRTTSGDGNGIGDAGTVQNIEGNEKIGEAYLTKGYEYQSSNNTTKLVGSIADEKTDKAYFLAAAPSPEKGVGSLVDQINGVNKISTNHVDVADFIPQASLEAFALVNNITIDNISEFNPNTIALHATLQNIYLENIDISPLKCWIDSIIEVDAKNETHRNIFIDKYAVTGRLVDIMPGYNDLDVWAINADDSGGGSAVSSFQVQDGSIFRVGMIVRLYDDNNNDVFFANGVDDEDGVGVEIVSIENNIIGLATPQQTSLYLLYTDDNLLSEFSAITFIHPERVLQFDYNKLITGINILDELLFYTDGTNEPKKLNIERCKAGTEANPTGVPAHTKLFVFDNEPGEPDLVDATEMEWDLDNSDIKREHITVIRKAPTSPPTLEMRDTDRLTDVQFTIDHTFISLEDVGDESGVPQVGQQTSINIPGNFDLREGDVLTLNSAVNTLDPVLISVRIITIFGEEVQGNILIEFLFVDEEIQIYNPGQWVVTLNQEKALFETKFGRVGYRYKYEDGECSSFSPWSELAFLPQKFSYTPSQGFNNGMENSLRSLVIKDFIPDETIRPNDVKIVELLWKTTDDQNVYIIKSITRGRSGEWKNFETLENENYGRTILTSEMIYKVLSSDQLFRTWDNVPISALAQEITANRLIYGNYKQGYKITKDVSLIQNVNSNFIPLFSPRKSVKSLRNYKFGVVLGDAYGRETSVLVDGYESGTNTIVTGDINIEKSLSALSNRFNLRQDWGFNNSPGAILQWAEYAKYYVKETSNEYYNLILDRWYDSGDGNIWLSFPSVDRNKVDEETYLILKNGHGDQTAIAEKARYKILAITGEAPDFIKTQRKIFEKVEIDTLGIYGSNSSNDGIPHSLIDKNEIRTLSGTWNNIGINQDDIKGNLKMRIVGRMDNIGNTIELKTRFVNVSRLVGGGGVPRKGADIQEEFTSTEVNMAQRFLELLQTDGVVLNTSDVDEDFESDGSTPNPDYIKYFMEFADEVVENKPQFDGRFFVKIEKDSVLQERVLNQAGAGGIDFTPEGSPYNIAYIANLANNPATIGGGNSFGGVSWGGYTVSNTDFSTSTINDITSPISFSALYDSDGPGVLGSNIPDYNNPNPAQNTLITGDKTPAMTPDGYAWNFVNWSNTSDGTLTNWETDGVPMFGPGDPVNTENFWNWWISEGEGDTPNRTATIFLDEAPAYAGYNLVIRAAYQSGIFVSSLDTYGLSGSGGDGGGFYKPYGEILGHFGLEHSSMYIGSTVDYEQLDGNVSYYGDGGVGTLFKHSLDERGIYGSRQNAIDQVLHPSFFQPRQSSGSAFNELNYFSMLSHKPNGLSIGMAEDGMGQMLFSMVGQEGDFGNGPENEFYERMLSVGQHFRFTEDGTGSVYRVVANKTELPILHAGSIEDGGGGSQQIQFHDFEGRLEWSSVNFRSNPGNSDIRTRHTILVNFAKVFNGTLLEGQGVDTTSFDPRGIVQHNGIGSFGIQFLTPTNEGELSNDTVITQNACFETEPKKDLDVDIYYEASKAIPMLLKTKNIKSFFNCNRIPKESCTVIIDERVKQDSVMSLDFQTISYNAGNWIESSETVQDNFNSQYTFTTPPFVYTTLSDNIINIKASVTKDENDNYDATAVQDFNRVHTMNLSQYSQNITPVYGSIENFEGIAIGDRLSFRHSDGTVTRTVVKDHVIPLDSTGTYTWARNQTNFEAVNSFNSHKLSNRFSVSNTFLQGIDFILSKPELLLSVSTNTFNKIKFGMEVQGDNIEKGTFVMGTQSSGGASLKRILLSQNLIDNASTINSDITFIQTTGWYEVDKEVFKFSVDLPWFNCYAFGNGVESDRIRDDFNAPQIDNGVKVSSTFLEYGEENISSGLIHSSELYNNTSSVNGLNEFSMAQKITKNLNPIYGSIQALKTRDTDVVVFAEDKILKVLANKDAVFNADGNTQLTATNRVLGQTIPFVGDYGISKNPESLAADNYRVYFTDKQRGAVMRLSRDGLTPISNVGMKSYFREYLRMCENIVGTFDIVSGEYNIKLGINEVNQNETVCNENGCTVIAEPTTVSFNEAAKSWVSFKSFKHNCGVSVTGKYITAPTGAHALTNVIWKHNSKQTARNNFYGENNISSIDILFNDQSDSVKSFKSLNYEGSDSYIVEDLNDNNYYNIQSRPGWKVQNISTDLQSGKISEFIKKESKYFNYITSGEVSADNIDTSNLDIQGIGYALQIGETTASSTTFETSVNTDGTGTVNVGTTTTDSSQTDADTEITIEDEDGNTNETGEGGEDGSEIITTSQLPQFDEVGVVTDGISYSILAKVSGGSGNYRFVLVAKYADGVSGQNPFPVGNNYVPIYSGEGSADSNAWATWPGVIDGSNTIENQFVPLDHDWSYNEYQFASHTQFPSGLKLYPTINGVQSYNELVYDILVLDADNPAGGFTLFEGTVQEVFIDINYNYYPNPDDLYGNAIGYPFSGQSFYYSNIILDQLPILQNQIVGFPQTQDNLVNITSFDFVITDNGNVQTGTEQTSPFVIIPIFETSYAIFITEINGFTGNNMIQFVQDNNIIATLLDGTPEGNAGVIDFEGGTGFFVIGSETPILDTNPGATGGGANIVDFNLTVTQQSNASGGMSQGVVINSNIEYTSLETYIGNQLP